MVEQEKVGMAVAVEVRDADAHGAEGLEVAAVQLGVTDRTAPIDLGGFAAALADVAKDQVGKTVAVQVGGFHGLRAAGRERGGAVGHEATRTAPIDDRFRLGRFDAGIGDDEIGVPVAIEVGDLERPGVVRGQDGCRGGGKTALGSGEDEGCGAAAHQELAEAVAVQISAACAVCSSRARPPAGAAALRFST